MLMSAEEFASNYERLQERIAALLGPEQTNDLKISETFQMRHRLVHHGEDCSSSKKALHLAAVCLVNFSNLAARVQECSRPQGLALRDATLQYLDLLSHTEKLAWLEPEKFTKFNSVNIAELKTN